jgi:SAM-dependent methyltransferase
MARLRLQSLVTTPHNAHYEGAFDETTLRWYRICALDKVANIASSLESVGTRGIERVLEVGCGTGAVLLEAKRAGIGTEHLGIDLADPDMHRQPGLSEAGIALSTYDGVTIPFEDASFDLVYASHVLEHVPDERGFLAELARVCAGWIYIEVPCEVHLRTSMRALQTTLGIGHINAYTPETLALTLTTSGLPPVETQIFDHSDEIYAFTSGPLKARAKAALRRSMLAASPRLASRLLTYHVGALIDVASLRAAAQAA